MQRRIASNRIRATSWSVSALSEEMTPTFVSESITAIRVTCAQDRMTFRPILPQDERAGVELDLTRDVNAPKQSESESKIDSTQLNEYRDEPAAKGNRDPWLKINSLLFLSKQ